MEDESGDVFKVNLEILDEPVAAFFVTGRMNKCVQNGSNLSEVHCGSLNQGEDESGEEVDSTGVPVKVGFQGLLEFCMLFRRASDLCAGGFNCFIWRAGRLSRTYVRYYGADDMQKLLASCAKNSRVNEQFRDVNLVAFLYGTGLRINEALGLKLEDVRYKTEADGFQTPVSVRVIGKGDKERMVPLSDTAQRALFQWLRRRKLEGGSTPFVWVQLTGTTRGKTLTDRGVRRMVTLAVWTLVLGRSVRTSCARVTRAP